jgi:hypothetical protein
MLDPHLKATTKWCLCGENQQYPQDRYASADKTTHIDVIATSNEPAFVKRTDHTGDK